MSRTEFGEINARNLYVIASKRFPEAISNTTIPDLQRSAYRQIVGGWKTTRTWARQNKVSKDFAKALLICYLRDGHDVRDEEQKVMDAIGVYA